MAKTEQYTIAPTVGRQRAHCVNVRMSVRAKKSADIWQQRMEHAPQHRQFKRVIVVHKPDAYRGDKI